MTAQARWVSITHDRLACVRGKLPGPERAEQDHAFHRDRSVTFKISCGFTYFRIFAAKFSMHAMGGTHLCPTRMDGFKFPMRSACWRCPWPGRRVQARHGSLPRFPVGARFTSVPASRRRSMPTAAGRSTAPGTWRRAPSSPPCPLREGHGRCYGLRTPGRLREAADGNGEPVAGRAAAPGYGPRLPPSSVTGAVTVTEGGRLAFVWAARSRATARARPPNLLAG